MNSNKNIVNNLSNFKAQNPFSESEWGKRGLNPSNPEKVKEMIYLTNLCVDELISDLNTEGSYKQLKSTLVKGLNRFKSSNYDSEEKELISDIFYKISKIVDVNVSVQLTNWLYGRLLGTVLRLTKKKGKTINSQSIQCMGCDLTLSIHKTSHKEGIPNHWMIVKCDQCGEYNLLTTGENAGALKFENFESIDLLSDQDNSEEQAKMRLEQIRHFRTN